MKLILAGLVLLMACDAKTSDQSKPAAAAKAPEAPAVAAAPTVEVTAGQLFNAYASDVDAADAKYLGKRLRVRALVGSGGHGRTLLELEAAGGQGHVNAWFSDDGAKAIRALKHYDEVTLACTGGGFAAVPELKDCVIETGRAAGL